MFLRLTPERFFAADTGAGTGGSPAGAAAAEAGMVLGSRYRLVSPIASGGMAQVWRAQDGSLSRDVAIKVLHPHLATDEAFVARFRREAVAAARLSHPSIVAVYDTLSEGGIEAIVMELIEGRTLRAVLDEASVLPARDVVDVGMQISNALDEAHRAGIVHRDIKPANIMVSADRRIMVTDFGIAKAQKDADLTHTGTLLGTAKYLAPEQVAGEPVDARADIYALGVVLFEAATGQPPFLADNDAGTALARLQNEVPRCRHRRPSVPVGLDEIIARTMARSPADRYARASELRDALNTVNLTDVRMDTSDLGPTVQGAGPGTGQIAAVGQTPPPGFGAPSSGFGAPPAAGPMVPPGPNTGVSMPVGPPNSGTAVLSSQPGMTPPPPSKLNRKQKKALKQAEKRAGGRQPVMPIEGRQRPTKTMAAVLIIGGLLVAGVLLLTLLQPDTSTGDVSFGFGGDGEVTVLVDATTFDPFGDDDGEENENLVANAIDGDEETLWRTSTYNRAGLGGLKPGLGLILIPEEAGSFGDLTLVTRSQGWNAEIYVADEFGPNDNSFDPESLGEPAATVTDGEGTTTVSLDGASGSQILVWITETGLGINVDGNEVHRFVLSEASL